jgi:hypothetical protein
MDAFLKRTQKDLVNYTKDILSSVYRDTEKLLVSKFKTEEEFITHSLRELGMIANISAGGKNMLLVTSGGKVRKPRVANKIPVDELCEARKKSLQQCGKRKKDNELYCNVHTGSRPYGTIRDTVAAGQTDPLHEEVEESQSNITEENVDNLPEPEAINDVPKSKKNKKKSTEKTDKKSKKKNQVVEVPESDNDDNEVDQDSANNEEAISVTQDDDGHLIDGTDLYEPIGDDGDAIIIGSKINGKVTLAEEHYDEYSAKYKKWLKK